MHAVLNELEEVLKHNELFATCPIILAFNNCDDRNNNNTRNIIYLFIPCFGLWVLSASELWGDCGDFKFSLLPNGLGV